jgi:hypothetical protein
VARSLVVVVLLVVVVGGGGGGGVWYTDFLMDELMYVLPS